MATKPKSEPKPELTAEEEMEFMRTAPIAEVAAYLGGDLDLAVQLRIDAVVDETYRKLGKTRSDMEISIRPIEPQGNLYGFASVTIGSIRIDDFKIVENKDGELFVGLPSKPDKTSTTGYRNTVHVDKEFRYDFNAAVLREYRATVEQARSRADNLRTAPDKPERMADQLKKAGQEASKANAARPTKEKGKEKVKRDDR